MRPISSLTALAGGAGRDRAGAASSDYYLHLGDVKEGLAANAGSGKTIEILSWSWGAASAGEVRGRERRAPRRWPGRAKSASTAG